MRELLLFRISDWLLGGGYSVGVFIPVEVDVVPPRGSTQDFLTVPRPGQVPGVGPVESVGGRAGPVAPTKWEVSRRLLVPEGTGSAPATGTSVLITATVIVAAFELTKLGL